MDISAYFSVASKSLTATGSTTNSDGESDVRESNPLRKHCPSATYHSKSHTTTRIRKYNKKWEEEFTWLEFDEDCQGAFCRLCEKRGKYYNEQGR